MKIVHVISNLGKGGAERLVVDLCNELSLIPGNEVFICVFYEKPGQPSFKHELNDRVVYINLSKKGKIDFIFQFRLIRFLRKLKPDVINSHLSGAVLYLYLPVLILKKITFFHTIHNLAEEEIPVKSLQKLRKFIYKTGRLIPVSISLTTKESHSNLYGIDSKLIYNGVQERTTTVILDAVKREIESYKKKQETKVFLSVGRINSPKDQKNYKLLVEVFNKLYPVSDAILLIIGMDNSPNQSTLNALIELKSENVFFLGVKGNVTDYMTCADVYCLSSKFEGLPITVIEALSHGLPVISTKVGGIPELITHNENGILVEKLNVEDYYSHIIEMMSWDMNKLKEVEMANIRKYKEQFDIKIAAQKYLNLYLESKKQLV